ncbi:MAG: oligosaccharide flippase family protein [Ignavibacteriales bacterium]|nr:oligosaccharide flippase family protein [Ignavibacteriales bacterium]
MIQEVFCKYFLDVCRKSDQAPFSFFIGIFLVRYLGPDQFGILSYAVSFALLFASLANFGLDNILVRELVKFPEEQNTILGSAFMLRVVGSAAVLIITWFAVKINNESDDVALLIYIISAGTIFQAFHVIEFSFRGKFRLNSRQVFSRHLQCLHLCFDY